MRILVLEDDPILANGMVAGLTLHGMAAECVETCADALALLDTTTFSAAILDLMLPDGSGLDVLRHLRARNNATPVLLLTARDATGDRVAGLDGGADDYMGKPFDLDELAARLRAMIRRAAGRSTSTISWRNIVIDLTHQTVTRDSKAINLSRREYALLEALMERPGRVFSKSQLESHIYGWQEEIESNALEVHVHHLRAKIGREAIETVRGLGYRMREDRA
jgi:two-component system response regulator QseB